MLRRSSSSCLQSQSGESADADALTFAVVVDPEDSPSPTLSIKGVLNSVTVPLVDGCLHDVLTAHPGAAVRVDLSQVTGIDSDGTAWLLVLDDPGAAGPSGVQLTALSPHIEQILAGAEPDWANRNGGGRMRRRTR